MSPARRCGWVTKSRRLILRPPGAGAEGTPLSKAGAGSQGPHAGQRGRKVGPGQRCSPRGGSRPLCRGRAPHRDLRWARGRGFSFLLRVDPKDSCSRGGGSGPRRPEAQGAWDAALKRAEGRLGLLRPVISPLSLLLLAWLRKPASRLQPSPFSSPHPVPGSAFPPSTLGRIQSEKAPLSFCVCWGRCGRRRDRVTTFIS